MTGRCSSGPPLTRSRTLGLRSDLPGSLFPRRQMNLIIPRPPRLSCSEASTKGQAEGTGKTQGWTHAGPHRPGAHLVLGLAFLQDHMRGEPAQPSAITCTPPPAPALHFRTGRWCHLATCQDTGPAPGHLMWPTATHSPSKKSRHRERTLAKHVVGGMMGCPRCPLPPRNSTPLPRQRERAANAAAARLLQPLCKGGGDRVEASPPHVEKQPPSD